jgi:hypothetical protein
MYSASYLFGKGGNLKAIFRKTDKENLKRAKPHDLDDHKGLPPKQIRFHNNIMEYFH